MSDKELALEGLSKCFGVDQNVVRCILTSNKWNVEKSLPLIEALSPKVGKNTKNVTSGATGSKGTSASKDKKNKNKKKDSESNVSGSSKDSKVKNKVKPTVTKENFHVGRGNEPWALVDIDKKSQKNKQKNGKTNGTNVSMPSPSNRAVIPQDTPIFKSAPKVKKEKRAELKSVYEIIEQKQSEIDRIRDCIKYQIRIIVLMRGCPGSGKSTFAQQLLLKNGIKKPENHIYSTDDYFMDAKGNYNYTIGKLEQAHAWNQGLVEKLMKLSFSPIIVDNTHIKAWEMKAYAEFAVKQGYVLETLQPPTPWFFNETILSKKNIHGVPKNKIASMLENYEANLTGVDLFKKLNIAYMIQQSPPQVVSYTMEHVLLVINKMKSGRMTALPKVSQTNCPEGNKTKQKIIPRHVLTEDIEVIQEIPIQKMSLIPPVQPNAVDNVRSFKKQINPYFATSSCVENVRDDVYNQSELSNNAFEKWHNKSLNDFKFQPTVFSRSPQRYQFSSQQLSESPAVNLIDYPIDEGLGSSLLSPLTPQSNISQFENMAPPNKTEVSFDPSEFPSLSGCVSSKSETGEINKISENFKKITELFPHLDKDYVRDLCGDPNIHIDSIIESLLESNIDLDFLKDNQSENNVTNCEIGGNDDANISYKSSSSSSSDEEGEYEEGIIDVDKDINMLIQLFTNISEKQIREVYLKCGQQFRDALEELLKDDSEDIAPSDEKHSSVSPSSDNETIDSLKSEKIQSNVILSETQLIKSDIIPDRDGSNKNIDTNVAGKENNEKLDDSLKLKGNSCLSDIKSPLNKNFSEVMDNLIQDQDNLFNLKSNLIKTSENNDSSTSTKNMYNCNVNSNQDIVNLQVNKSNDQLNVFTLDKFKLAMCNVLTSLGQSKSNTSSDEIASSSNTQVTENSVNSELISTILDWNFSDKLSDSVKCDDCEPKEQRERLNSGLRNNATNTNYKDFELLKKAQTSDITSEKIMFGTMNFVGSFEPIGKSVIPKDKLMLDKGITTVDVESGYVTSNNDNESLLASMFPNIPPEDLESLLKSCVGDLNWAVGLLLDSGHEISHNFNPSDHNVEISNILNPSQSSNDSQSTSLHPDVKYPLKTTTLESPQSLKNKKRNGRIPVPAEQLNFVMSDESISDHVKKIRNARLGLESNEVSQDNYYHPSQLYFDDDSNVLDSSEEEDRDEETLAVALSTDFILALQAQFGGFIPNVSPDNQVLVNLPISLARQLHLCIFDSLTQQLEEDERLMNKMIEEDESFARRLQDIENGVADKSQSIQEIMDEELALNMHQSLNKNKSNKDTIAGKLTRQLLIERFPAMDPVALKSILDDTDYSLHQATQLLETAGYNSDLQSTPQPSQIHVNQLSRQEVVEQANAYRNAAKKFFEMRQEYFLKAQKAYSDGMKHVASYYSQMANWHNQRIEQANLLASTMLMTGNQNALTLDLHFLRVCEALQVLDLFIDAHIRNLVEIKQWKREVYIITGRGLHSPDGKSKIRPVTISRLNQRSIQFKILNPGLLLANLSSKTPLTYQN